MKSLVLTESGGHSLEHLYYAAVCIADPARAEKLYNIYQRQSDVTRFWMDAYNRGDYNETALSSAIVNRFDMPFGAYVVERYDDEVIEIAPWMFSSKFDRREWERKLFADDVSEEYLNAQQRMLELTAAFMHWLKRFSNKERVK